MTLQAAYALKQVERILNDMGYSLVVYDAYRPQKAVERFFEFIQEPEDFKTKKLYYPYITKQ